MSEHTSLTEAERIEQAIYDIAVDHPMWIGDVGQPLDYLPEREARIAEFVREAATALLAARTSTATADTARKATSASSLRHMPDPYAATTDTGARDRCAQD